MGCPMKKKCVKYLLFVIILVLCLSCLFACNNVREKEDVLDEQDQTVQLDTPQSLVVNGNIISWNAVLNASSYVVFIDKKEYPTTNTSFDLSTIDLADGVHRVKVIAWNGQLKSKESLEISFNYIKKNITYNLQVISQEGGSTNITSKDYTANSIVNLIAYPKESYHFDGWYSNTYYKVGSEKTFSFVINSDSVLFAFFSKDMEDTSAEASDDSQLMQCASDFSVVVLCPEDSGEEYIREHFFIYDDYFLNNEGNIVSGYEEFACRRLGSITDRGNNLFVVSPAEEYERSGSYVAKATGNVTILKEYSRFMNSTGAINGARNAASTDSKDSDKELQALANDTGRESLSFSVDNTPHEDIQLNDGVLIYSYTNNENATINNVDGWILERIGDGLTDKETGTLGGFITESIDSLFGDKVTDDTDEELISSKIIGKIVGFGSKLTKDIRVEQFDEYTVFGRVKSWQYCGEEKIYPIFFVELEPVEKDSDVFAVLDVYSEGDIDISSYIEENEELIQEGAMNAFCSSDDWIDFLVSVEIASSEYAKENEYENPGPLNAASFHFDKPEVNVSGTEVRLRLGGHIDITFAEKNSSFGKSGGKITISFSFEETLKLEYTFSWIKKDVRIWFVNFKITSGINLTVTLLQTSNFTFDIKFEYSAETKNGEAAQYRITESTKKFHVPTCSHIQNVNTSKDNCSALELENRGYSPCLDCIHTDYVLDNVNFLIHKPGCWHLKQISYEDKVGTNKDIDTLKQRGYKACQSCSGISKTQYYLNPSSKEVHTAGCKHLAAMTATTAVPSTDKLVTILDDGYLPCRTCLSNYQTVINEEAEQEKFTAKLFNALDYVDWGDQINEIKNRVKNAMNPDTSKDFALCEIPFNYVVTFWVKLYLTVSFKVEASLHFEIETYNRFTVGLTATIHDGFKSFYAKEESGKSMEFTLAGKVEAKVGLKLELGVSDPLGLIYVGIYGTVGMYADLSGIVHYSKKETTSTNLVSGQAESLSHEEKYAAAYLEIGFYYDFGLSYRVLTLKGSISLSQLFGLRGKIPLLTLGFNKTVYAYTNDISEASLLASEVKNEFTLEELRLLNVKTLLLPGLDQSTEVLDVTSKEYDINVNFISSSGYLSWDKNEKKIKVSPNAPFGQTFEDTVTIVIKSADPWFRLWTKEERKDPKTLRTICYLPTITVKLVCENNCSEHKLLYLETIDSTCTAIGYEECMMCMRCGKYFDVNAEYEMPGRKIINALGHDETILVAEEAGCLYSGLTEGKICTRCGKITVEQIEIEPLGHNASETWELVFAASCTSQGRESNSCTRCNTVLEYRPILPTGHTVTSHYASCTEGVFCDDCGAKLADALGHDYQINPDNYVPASCENAGFKQSICSNCGDVQNEDLDPTGHTPLEKAKNIVIIKFPTCTETGERMWYCQNENCDGTHMETIDGVETEVRGIICDSTIFESAIIPANGHNFYATWTVDTLAKCTETGTESRHCRHCDVRIDEKIIPATGHNLVLRITLYPDCENEGRGFLYCNNLGCDYKEENSVVPALGHQGNGATCTQPDICERCGVEIAPALGHNFVLDHIADATCEENGCEYYQCSRCEQTKNIVIDAIGHDYGEWEDYLYSTCVDPGLKRRVCNHDSAHIEYKEIAALGHSFASVYTIDIEPTCTESGSESRHCVRCSETTNQRSIVPLGHSYGDLNVTLEATCTSEGAGYRVCDRCDNTIEEIIPIKAHVYKDDYDCHDRYCLVCEQLKEGKGAHTLSYNSCQCVNCGEFEHELVNGVCRVCGAKVQEGIDRVGNEALFGAYPQTLESDPRIIAGLNRKIAGTPTASNLNGWTEYDYFVDAEPAAIMWYIDNTYAGEAYRGIIISAYRPSNIKLSANSENSKQDEYGYSLSEIYWFKYEPIRWTILSQHQVGEDENSYIEAELIANLALDSRHYLQSEKNRTIQGNTVYPNNWEYSQIRSFLNDTFYNTAFDSTQKEYILHTLIDNSSTAEDGNNNVYASMQTNTFDSVYLLSYSDYNDIKYNADNSLNGMVFATDYAKAQGVYTSTAGYAKWWLRSPASDLKTGVSTAGVNGEIYTTLVTDSNIGVVPVIRIKNLPGHIHNYSTGNVEIKTQPTCTQEGLKWCYCACGEAYIEKNIAKTPHNYSYHALVNAACETTGMQEYYTCSDCDTIFDSEKHETNMVSLIIPVAGHDFIHYDIVDSTCTATGKEEHYVCSVCGKVFDANHAVVQEEELVIPTKSHTYNRFISYLWGDDYSSAKIRLQCSDCTAEKDFTASVAIETIKNATCEKEGSKTYKATYDGYVQYAEKKVSINALGHDPEQYDTGNATCTVPEKHYYRCTRCGVDTGVSYSGSALGHEYDKITSESYEEICIRTQENNNNPLHFVIEEESTCTTQGKGYYTCIRCGQRETNENGGIVASTILPFAAHTYSPWEEEVPATCTVEGHVAYQYCNICKKNYDKNDILINDIKISANGHSVNKIEKLDADCTNDGHEEYYSCKNCSYKYYIDNEQQIVPIDDENDEKIFIAKGHHFIPHTQYCSYDQVGWDYWECDKCHTFFKNKGNAADTSVSYEDESVIKFQTKHTAVAQEFDYDNIPEDSCGYWFTREYICQQCNPGIGCNSSDRVQYMRKTCTKDDYNESTKEYLGGHYGIGNCLTCGVTLSRNDNFSQYDGLVYTDKGSYYEVSIKGTGSSTIMIPSIYCGKIVKTIKENGFSGATGIQRIYIPNTITEIGNNAFEGCSNLSTVVIYDPTNENASVVSLIAAWCKVSFGNDLSNPMTLSKVQNVCFGKNEKLSGEIDLTGTGITKIPSFTFKCTKISKIIIPESVTNIENSIFYSCSELQSITVPFIGDRKVTVDSTNQYPIGFLFGGSSASNGVKTVQEYYGNSTTQTTTATYYIPESVKNIKVTGGIIPYGAFRNCNNLESVDLLSQDIITMPAAVFYGCGSLKSLTLPFIGRYLNPNYAYSPSNVLGFVFGENSYDGAIQISQQYAPALGWSRSQKIVYYIPEQLETIVLTDRAQQIPSGAFYGCKMLKEIKFSSTITTINEYAFSGCSGLENVYYNGNIEDWFNVTFVKGSWELMGLSANPLYYASKLYFNEELVTEIEIPNSITKIDDYAFYKLTDLEKVVMGNNVTSIGSRAFQGCVNLTQLTIPDSVTHIGSLAFYGCSNLQYNEYNNGYYLGNATNAYHTLIKLIDVSRGNVTISDKTKIIYSNALSGWENPYNENIIIPNSVLEIGSDAFENVIIYELTLPDSLQRIGDRAFYGCTWLRAVYNNSSLDIVKGSTSNGYVGYYAKTVYNSQTALLQLQTISCDCDNNYDTFYKPEDDELARTEIEPDVLDFKITGSPSDRKSQWLVAVEPDSSVSLMSIDKTKASEFSFGFKFKQDTNNIKLTNAEGSLLWKAVICDDSWTTVKNTNVNSTIHKGVYWYKVTYDNGESDQYYQCNFMNNKKEGDYINAWSLWQNDSNKKGTINNIVSVNIIVAYEIDGSYEDSGHTYTNWVYESHIYFD